MASTTKSVLIEIGEEPAGVVVESPKGLIFHAVHPKLTHLHGVSYKSVAAAESAVREAMKERAKAS